MSLLVHSCIEYKTDYSLKLPDFAKLHVLLSFSPQNLTQTWHGYVGAICDISQLCSYQQLQNSPKYLLSGCHCCQKWLQREILGNKAWNHNLVSKPARVFEAQCSDCRRKCIKIQGEKSPKGTFPITSVSHPTPPPALNNFHPTSQLVAQPNTKKVENWKLTKFDLRIQFGLMFTRCENMECLWR